MCSLHLTVTNDKALPYSVDDKYVYGWTHSLAGMCIAQLLSSKALDLESDMEWKLQPKDTCFVLQTFKNSARDCGCKTMS